MNTSQTIWTLLGAVALLLRFAAGYAPEWVETLYSRGLFLIIRNGIDYGAAWMPFPLAYIFFPAFLLWIGFRSRRFFRNRAPWKHKLKGFASALLAFTGGLVFLFLFLWGFNYSRLPLESQLGLELQPLTPADIREELDLSTAALLTARKRIPAAGDAAVGRSSLPPKMESYLRKQVAGWLQEKGFPTPGRVRGRTLYPKGVLLRFGTAGVYFPFTGEGHADAGLHPLQLPAVLAHELAHGFGFGDEGVCNYIAYAACVKAGDPLVAYAAELSYWRTLAANYRAYEPEAYRAIRENLPAGIRADLDDINQTMLAYPDLFPRFRDAAYNTYLKAQGVEEGMLSYDKVMMLVRAERKQKPVKE